MALDPVTALLDIGTKVIDRLWPDPVQAANAKIELLKMQQSGDLQVIAGQLAVNVEEAKNPSVFVSGWRPFIGWVCGAACAWNWIGISVANTVFTVLQHPVALTTANLTEMMPILIGMLGLGGLRTVERIQGVARA